MGRRAAEQHGKLGPAGAAAVAAATGAEGDDPAEGATPKTANAEVTGALNPNDAAGAKDRAVMSGGPGDAIFQEFEFAGKTFKTQADLTAHLEAASAEIADLKKARETPTSTEVVVPKQAASSVEVPKVLTREDQITDALKDFSEDEFFKDPKGTMAKFMGRTLSMAEKNLTDKYVAEQNMQGFWTSFYDTNKDLKEKGEVVNLVLNEHMKTLGPMVMVDASKELARLVRQKLVSWGITTAKVPKDSTALRTTVEGGGSAPNNNSNRKEAVQEQQGPTTISGVIKARQAARRKSATQTA